MHFYKGKHLTAVRLLDKWLTESFQDFMIYKKLQDYLDRVYENFRAESLRTFTLIKLPRWFWHAVLHLYKNRGTESISDPHLVSSSLFLPGDYGHTWVYSARIESLSLLWTLSYGFGVRHTNLQLYVVPVRACPSMYGVSIKYSFLFKIKEKFTK